MQLVTPSVVPTAVSTAIITCKIVFQTSFFIFFFLSFFNGSTICFFLNFRKFFPTRPERAEAPSPGRCPGLGASALSGRVPTYRQLRPDAPPVAS